MPAEKLNPYAVAPSESSEDVLQPITEAPPGAFDFDVISTPGMLLSAITTTTAAGMIFGFGLIIVGGVAGWFLNPSPNAALGPNELLFALLAAGIAGFAGGVIASMTAVPVSLLMWLCTVGVRDSSRHWTVSSMRIMHYGTGGVSGWISLFLLMRGELSGVLVAVIPAGVGCAVAGLIGERKIAAARRSQARVCEKRKARDSAAGLPRRASDPSIEQIGCEPDPLGEIK